jgi:U3 small nucleolar RNA-associated protein 20
LAVQLCGLFLTVERDKFEQRLPTILPLLSKDLCPNAGPGRFVRAPKEEPDPTILKQGTVEDHLLFQTLQLLIKISMKMSKWLTKYDEAKFISEQLQPLLCHAHEWVRFATSQFLGCVFASLDPVAVGKAIKTNTNDESLLLFSDDPGYHVKSLTLDLCELLQNGISVQFADQIIKNLVYLARVIRHGTTQELSLTWLAKRLRGIVHEEVANAPSSTVLRCAVLKWSAGVALDVGAELSQHNILLHHLLAPVARELNETSHPPPELKKLAKEVASLVKKQVRCRGNCSSSFCLVREH